MIKRVLLFWFLISSAGCLSHGQLADASKVCFKEYCFEVELADTEDERMRGLQHRQEMPDDQGMLFVFPFAAKHGFWMKDTLIPLDMIWLDYKKEVVYIATNVPPCKSAPCPSYTPDKDAMYVLELNAGLAKKLEVNIGDQLNLQLPE